MEMPLLNLDGFTAEEKEIASLIVATQGKNKGRLRAAKPKIEYTIKEGRRGGRYRFSSYLTGCAAYVWRMVAFQVSPMGQHKCLPMMADFDLPGESILYEIRSLEWEAEDNKRKELRKAMDALVDKIVATVPRSKQYGLNAWGNALYGQGTFGPSSPLDALIGG